MRLWSLHPRYLDAKGLVALWREALLAKHVLSGHTKGYKHHPQLRRFREFELPLDAINYYLESILNEADSRGYRFNADKIDRSFALPKLNVTSGQIEFERSHLLNKLRTRDPERYANLILVSVCEPNPVFSVIEGEIESWERPDTGMNKKISGPVFEMPSTEPSDQLIRLRRVHSNDFEELYAVASDPLIWEQHPASDRYKRDVFQKFFEKALKGGGAFAIIDRKTNEIIGSSRYYDIGKESDSVAIGYTFLARKYWGGEYNRAVKMLMLDHAFKFVSRVLFHIGADNLRSQKAIEKLGAVRIKEMPPENEGDGLSYEYLIER